MAASNAGGVLLKAEETKEIKIPNFRTLHAGYVEGGFHLQDAALSTIVVRVFPCGRRGCATKDYVSVLFRKQWLRTFPLTFHCTTSIIDIYGERKYTQTCGMEELERDFEIEQFVKRSTLFENDFELLPNDKLTVLCEVSYTMPSSQRSSKIWSVLSRLYAWYPPKRDDFCKKPDDEDMCSLIVETMDGGEFLLPTPLSYFKIETDAVSESIEETSSKSIQKSESSKEIIIPASLGSSVDNVSIQSKSLSSMDSSSKCSLANNIQTASLESTLKKNSKINDKKDITSILSGINLTSGKKDRSGLISAITEMLSNTNLLSNNAYESAITKGSIPSCANSSKGKMTSAFNGKTLFGTGCKNKTLNEVPISDLAMFSKNKIPDIQRNISNTGAKIKRMKPESEKTAALNTKILDLHSKKTVQGSDICDASPVFTRMLKTPMLENITKKVKLRNTDADTFDNFLYYLETHEIIAENFEKLRDLYKMADQYEVMDLMCDCAQLLIQYLDVQHFLDILELADMHSDDKLKRKVHKFFLKNEKTLLSSLKNDSEFLKWYGSWKKKDISSDTDASDDEIEVCDSDLNFYR
ncbi:Speckle-type POZ protein B like protein [Argiope bruennichi]|uniref:Speckle-type POZ protein B like protein n=1 Tax=Argiope bruennichi TaxID=94029 RepID=A0A8T0FP74_ARGBR|nr:Speckle-type POZ protein B like protein [Argiope bruennichi]